MNLAEFPLSVLSTRTTSDVKTLEFSDTIHAKDGELIQRRWTITSTEKFGLPTASDDEVLLGLLKLTVDGGFKDRKIFFTRYDLLRTLRWSTEGRSYQRVQRALDRLSGVRIKASNAFYDNELKSHQTKNFGIIDEYELNDGRDNDKPSFFVWSDVLFQSFRVGFIKKINFDFYLSLRSAVSKRLYRFLDKHFYYRSRISVNLFTLAHEKVGVSRNYRHQSSLRQQLEPAFEELIEVGFLGSYEYAGKGSGTEVTLSVPQRGAPTRGSRAVGNDTRGNLPPGVITLRQLLVARGVREAQVDGLLMNRSETDLQRMQQIITYVDGLIAQRSPLVSKNPAGFLYRAMEHPERFVLPGERRKQETLPLNPPALHPSAPRRTSPAKVVAGESDEAKAAYLVERKRAMDRYRASAEPTLVARLEREASDSLRPLASALSPERCREMVHHRVGERLLALFSFPEFEEWVRSQR